MMLSRPIVVRTIGYMTMLAVSLPLAGCAGWSQHLPTALLQSVASRPVLTLQSEMQEPTAPDLIEASGALEARGVAVAAELGGRVTRIEVDEGDAVSRGQVLVELDESDLAVEIAQARAALQVALAELAQAKAWSRPEEIAAARSVLQQALTMSEGSRQRWMDAVEARENPQRLQLRITAAQTDLALAEQDVELSKAELEAAKQSRDREKWGRIEYRIEDRGVAAAEEALKATQAILDGAHQKLEALQVMRETPLILEAEMHAAEAAYRIAQADAAVAEAELAAVQTPPLDEDVAIGAAKVHQAEAALHTLEVVRKKMALPAPCDGIVTSRAVETGEIAVPGAPLLTIADAREVTLTVYVPETLIGWVTLGQKAVATVDSYPDRGFMGQVVHIADQAEFTPRNVQTREERVNTVFAVKILLPNADQKLKSGMPADALIQIG
jgi:HlyD family secretion protein